MNKIITINGEFFTGGRDLADLLSKRLNLKVYDKKIIKQISQESGLNADYVENNESQVSRFSSFIIGRSIQVNNQHSGDQVQLQLIKVLKDIANEGDCIIIGRGADHILEDYNPFKVFIYSSDISYRVNRIIEARQLDKTKIKEKAIIKEIIETDKKRAKHYEFYSGLKWDDMKNHSLCIDISKLSIDTAAKMIEVAFQNCIEK